MGARTCVIILSDLSRYLLRGRCEAVSGPFPDVNKLFVMPARLMKNTPHFAMCMEVGCDNSPESVPPLHQSDWTDTTESPFNGDLFHASKRTHAQ